jgi:hypothetical protein
VVRVTYFDMLHVISVGSDRSLYNESLLLAREITELELGVQKGQENANTTEYNAVEQRIRE